jgi:hypothetical protein
MPAAKASPTLNVVTIASSRPIAARRKKLTRRAPPRPAAAPSSSARGASRARSAGIVARPRSALITKNTSRQPSASITVSSTPPPTIMPSLYPATWRPFASPRSCGSRSSTAQPSVATSCVAASRLVSSTAATSTRIDAPSKNASANKVDVAASWSGTIHERRRPKRALP